VFYDYGREKRGKGKDKLHQVVGAKKGKGEGRLTQSGLTAVRDSGKQGWDASFTAHGKGRRGERKRPSAEGRKKKRDHGPLTIWGGLARMEFYRRILFPITPERGKRGGKGKTILRGMFARKGGRGDLKNTSWLFREGMSYWNYESTLAIAREGEREEKKTGLAHHGLCQKDFNTTDAGGGREKKKGGPRRWGI